MLSYTFLRGTGKEDIVVPMVSTLNTNYSNIYIFASTFVVMYFSTSSCLLVPVCLRFIWCVLSRFYMCAVHALITC